MTAPTALITGASRGIGLGLAAECAHRGWNVVATCRAREVPVALAALRDLHGPAVRIVRLDVGNDDSIEAAGRRLAGEHIDFLVSNAAADRRSADLPDVGYEPWARTLRINAYAPLKLAQVFLDHVAGSRWRVIVAISSRMGSLAETGTGGRYAYRVSKAALNMTVRILSADLAPRGVTVVAVHPGWVRTGTGGPDAPTPVEDCARDFVDLLSTLTIGRTGRLLDVHGGALPW